MRFTGSQSLSLSLSLSFRFFLILCAGWAAAAHAASGVVEEARIGRAEEARAHGDRFDLDHAQAASTFQRLQIGREQVRDALRASGVHRADILALLELAQRRRLGAPAKSHRIRPPPDGEPPHSAFLGCPGPRRLPMARGKARAPGRGPRRSRGGRARVERSGDTRQRAPEKGPPAQSGEPLIAVGAHAAEPVWRDFNIQFQTTTAETVGAQTAVFRRAESEGAPYFKMLRDSGLTIEPTIHAPTFEQVVTHEIARMNELILSGKVKRENVLVPGRSSSTWPNDRPDLWAWSPGSDARPRERPDERSIRRAHPGREVPGREPVHNSGGAFSSSMTAHALPIWRVFSRIRTT